MAPLWRALRGHAVAVLNGHAHDMQRFRPVDGITEFVDGAGGHRLHPVNGSDPRLAFSDDHSFGALRLRLRRGVADYAFVDSAGHTLDSGRLALLGALRHRRQRRHDLVVQQAELAGEVGQAVDLRPPPSCG